jgi:hypothetical protein
MNSQVRITGKILNGVHDRKVAYFKKIGGIIVWILVLKRDCLQVRIYERW